MISCLILLAVACDSPQKITMPEFDASADKSDSGKDDDKSDSDTNDTTGDTTGDTIGDTGGDTAGDTGGDTAGDTGDTVGDTIGDTGGDTTGDTGDTVPGKCEPNPCKDVINSTGKCFDLGSGYSCECRTNYGWNSETLDCEQTGCMIDSDCGTGKICAGNSQCISGCSTDDDCRSYAGTYCNKKLSRCVNFYASNRACSEMNCQQGCCYAERGLAGMRCSADQNPATCGHCDQGQVYSPEEARCLDAACSTTTDNCQMLNAGSFNPPARCFQCNAGELICKASTSTSGCSSGRVINAKTCIPSGGECSASTDCCSGMPCIDGFCY